MRIEKLLLNMQKNSIESCGDGLWTSRREFNRTKIGYIGNNRLMADFCIYKKILQTIREQKR